MNLAFAILFLYLGAALIYLGTRQIEAQTPWGVFQTILTAGRGGD